MKTIHYLQMTALSLSCLSLSHAQPLINWGGDYVQSDQNSALTAINLYAAQGDPLSLVQIGNLDEAVNPVIGPAYSGQSARFLGGSQVLKLGLNQPGGQALASVKDNGAKDYISFRFQSPQGAPEGEYTAAALWECSVRYGQIKSIRAKSAGGIAGAVTSHIILRDDKGNYYVSETSITGGFGRNTWSVNAPAAERWARYQPGEISWYGNLNTLIYDTTLDPLTPITAIGWLAATRRDLPEKSLFGSDVTIESFIVEASQ
jgi:hypothetical protein